MVSKTTRKVLDWILWILGIIAVIVLIYGIIKAII